MKVVILYLAFLILVFSFIPFAFVSCNKGGDINSKTTITLYDKENGKISDINLEEYIIGVLSAEMPAEFSAEALKSQAVAARTYALRKINKELPEHKGADLCSDFAHCQAYSDTKKLKGLWKKNYKKIVKKLKMQLLLLRESILNTMTNLQLQFFILAVMASQKKHRMCGVGTYLTLSVLKAKVII